MASKIMYYISGGVYLQVRVREPVACVARLTHFVCTKFHIYHGFAGGCEEEMDLCVCLPFGSDNFNFLMHFPCVQK